MLKTTRSSIAIASKSNDNKVVGGGSRSDGLIGKLTKFSNPKSGNSVKPGNSKAIKEFKFLTSKARKAFNRLKKTFTKRSIFRYFDLECHIRIEIDISGYVIYGVLS